MNPANSKKSRHQALEKTGGRVIKNLKGWDFHAIDKNFIVL